MSTPSKKQSFSGGAAILAAAVVVVKLIGAVYKLPLNNILSAVGKTYFDTAYLIYNFLLTFQNGTVTITKDGEPVDVYGDGFFTEDSLWDVPGYENFTAGEDVAGGTVYMAIRQEPVPSLPVKSDGVSRSYKYFYGL